MNTDNMLFHPSIAGPMCADPGSTPTAVLDGRRYLEETSALSVSAWLGSQLGVAL